MELGRRLRALFFFAAFILCMSLCFVYAEEAPASRITVGHAAEGAALSTAPESHLLLWTGPQGASFLQPSEARVIEPQHAMAAPVATPSVLIQLESATHSRRHLFLHGRSKAGITSPSSATSESSILDLLLHQQLSSEAQIIQAQ